MRRSNSVDAEIRDLERQFDQLDVQNLTRLLGLYRRSQRPVASIECVLEIYDRLSSRPECSRRPPPGPGP